MPSRNMTSSSPLADVYKEFSDRETSYMDVVRDSIEQRADAALYAFKRLPGNIVVGGRIQHDATGDDAGMEYYGSISHQRVTRVGLLQTMAYMRGASDERVQRYYGVSAAEASSSGFTAFSRSSGRCRDIDT